MVKSSPKLEDYHCLNSYQVIFVNAVSAIGLKAFKCISKDVSLSYDSRIV